MLTFKRKFFSKEPLIFCNFAALLKTFNRLLPGLIGFDSG